MKKRLYIPTFLLLASIFGLRAQTDVPHVTVELIQTTPSTIIFNYHPNDACHHFYVYTDRGNEVALWSNIFGLTVDDVICIWGERIDTVSVWNSYWTDLIPNNQYHIYIVPYDSVGHRYPCEETRFSTPESGITGRSNILISSSFITDTSAYIVCVPNVETFCYYNGIIPADWFYKIGLDSVCRLVLNSSRLYETDRWGHLFLNRGTQYCAVALGQNGRGEFGDTTIHWFTTLGKKQIVEEDTAPVIFYNTNGADIDRIPEEQWNQYAVRAYMADKSRTVQEVSLGQGNIILATLPVSDYYVDIVRKSDENEVKELQVSIRKEDMTKERHTEEDGFVWTKMRQDYNYAIGDASGKALTPFIFTKLSYSNGVFIGKTHLDNRLYDVLLTPQGKYIINTDRHYDKIMYDSYSKNLYVSKSGKVGVCDMNGREIVKPSYDDILDMETYYKVLQKGLWGCIDATGKMIFPPKYQDFERTDSGYTVIKDGVKGYLDLTGKEIQ